MSRQTPRQNIFGLDDYPWPDLLEPMDKPPVMTGFDTEDMLFTDPRSVVDRRQKNDPDKIPVSGCRRKGERRAAVYLRSDNWWMKRNYNNNPE